MKRRWILGGGVLFLSLGGLALAHGMGVWPFEERSDQEEVAGPPTQTAEVKPPLLEAKAAKHAQPQEVLALTMQRLHQEALQHFYADPRNGFSRMPLVYDKVVKEWNSPWFSPGEIERPEALPYQKELEKIHAGSTNDFLTAKPETRKDADGGAIPFVTFSSTGSVATHKNKKHWEAKSVDLIGLIKNPMPVVYMSEKLPDMKTLSKAPTRPLDDFELVGLKALQEGENLFGRSRDGIIRMVGAVRANASCISCHEDQQEGDLLGAFSYTLREAEYRRGVLGRTEKLETPIESKTDVRLP